MNINEITNKANLVRITFLAVIICPIIHTFAAFEVNEFLMKTYSKD